MDNASIKNLKEMVDKFEAYTSAQYEKLEKPVLTGEVIWNYLCGEYCEVDNKERGLLINLNYPFYENDKEKVLSDLIEEYLMSLPVFSKCKVDSIYAHTYQVLFPILGGDGKIDGYDTIMVFNLKDKDYELVSMGEDVWKKRLRKDPPVRRDACLTELESIYGEVGTFKGRIHAIGKRLTSKTVPLRVRCFDAVFLLFAAPFCKKKFLSEYKKAVEKVEDKNKRFEKIYESDKKEWDFYQAHSQEQIDFIKEKQQEILSYLEGLGFIEKEEDNE